MIQSNIIEIFKSIQGEGKYAGTPQVFVRFFECNMHCVWCDTPHSIGDTTKEYRTLPTHDILGEIAAHAGDTMDVSLTGGEPLVQADAVKDIAERLRENGMRVHLDTNGTLPEALEKTIDDLDVVAMDLKLPSSTRQMSYWAEHEQFLRLAARKDVFIKAVISCDTSEEDMMKARDLVYNIDAKILFILQPNTFELGQGVMQKCTLFEQICSEKLKQVRILPQTHKMMKIR